MAAARVRERSSRSCSRLRWPAARRLPLAYGWVSKRADAQLTRSWIEPALQSAAIRRDAASFLSQASKRYTLEAAERFSEFKKPVLLAWAPEDRFFKMDLAKRLERAFPDVRLELIEDSYTFRAHRPARAHAELIAAFAREPALAH